jgi:hypothetical protein
LFSCALRFAVGVRFARDVRNGLTPQVSDRRRGIPWSGGRRCELPASVERSREAAVRLDRVVRRGIALPTNCTNATKSRSAIRGGRSDPRTHQPVRSASTRQSPEGHGLARQSLRRDIRAGEFLFHRRTTRSATGASRHGRPIAVRATRLAPVRWTGWFGWGISKPAQVNLVIPIGFGFPGNARETSQSDFRRSNDPDRLSTATMLASSECSHGVVHPANQIFSLGVWIGA